MHAPPLVSIVVPVYNDADVIANALDSCLSQSLMAVEVIVVDDASTDDTAAVVEEYAARDPRVRLIRQERNGSAYQARRIGILAARAEHLLFLDGDDELADGAAEATLEKALATSADLVQFGVDVVHVDGRTGGPFEARLQPKHSTLAGTNVLQKLFPLNSPAQGQLWRYLFRTQLLADAYALMPADLVLPRVNDLPIMFLTAALAQRFESIPDRAYRYHFGRGGSGQKVRDLETAAFYAGAIHSIDSISQAVQQIADTCADTETVLEVYASVRRAIIAYTTHYLAEHTRADLLDAVFADLYTRASPHDVVQSTALHWPKALDTLAAHGDQIALEPRQVRSILLTTNHLRTGGISAVVAAQARLLSEAGFQVTIAAREKGSDLSALPAGVAFVEVTDASLGAAVAEWSAACQRYDVDLVIDHQWQYSTTWQVFALASRAHGAATIGWSHNFAGRSLLLGLDRLERAPLYFPLLQHLVVLSPLDVAFWKLRGMPRVSYLPNPPSPLLVDAGLVDAPKAPPMQRRIELLWWGRLQERTKRVTELLDVAEQLERLGVDFRLRIIGPDWRDMTAKQLNRLAHQRGLAARVEAIGPLHGSRLIAAIDESDVFVNTSIIEGYPLAIPEAQSRGLPVAMYRLPWLALAEANPGIATAEWGDAAALADLIVSIVFDPARYTRASTASLEAAARELSHDFGTLYRELTTGDLPRHLSPEPTVADVSQLLDLSILFAEQRSRARNSIVRSTAANSTKGVYSTLPERALRKAAPFARSLLRIAPWMQPAAQRVRRMFAIR